MALRVEFIERKAEDWSAHDKKTHFAILLALQFYANLRKHHIQKRYLVYNAEWIVRTVYGHRICRMTEEMARVMILVNGTEMADFSIRVLAVTSKDWPGQSRHRRGV